MYVTHSLFNVYFLIKIHVKFYILFDMNILEHINKNKKWRILVVAVTL